MSWRKVYRIGWFVFISLSARSIEAITYSYDAIIDASFGPHSAMFRAGEKVVITYTLDPLAVDTNSNPQYGTFINAVLSMTISFPNTGVLAVAGPAGTAQTFDNVIDQPSGQWADGIYLFGGPISSSSSLDGEPISFLEVDLGTGYLTPPAEPLLFSSDALPLFKLPITKDESVLFLGTSSGFTQVDFAAADPSQDPDPPPVPALSSTEYPNFRFWVRISGTRIGTLVAPCLPETVCVAGAVPTRAEIFVRIVGPKPNGYLWPSIVKFNTTKTEVWIQQITTGVTKYYLLQMLPTDSGILPGVVDKMGFLP